MILANNLSNVVLLGIISNGDTTSIIFSIAIGRNQFFFLLSKNMWTAEILTDMDFRVVA